MNSNYQSIVLTVGHLIKRSRFSVHDEKALQNEIEELFNKNSVSHKREYALSAESRPDFMIEDVAVEVKIKGVAKDIYRQCERYSKFDEVAAILLITGKSIGFPKELNGKPCFLLTLSNAWL